MKFTPAVKDRLRALRQQEIPARERRKLLPYMSGLCASLHRYTAVMNNAIKDIQSVGITGSNATEYIHARLEHNTRLNQEMSAGIVSSRDYREC